MPLDENAFREQANSRQENYESFADHLAGLEESGEAGLTNIIAGNDSLRSDCWKIGKRVALLGEASQADEWFARGADHGMTAVETALDNWEEITREKQMHTPLFAHDVLLSAVLARDESRMDTAAAMVESVDPAHPDDFPSQAGTYYTMGVLQGLISDMDEQQLRNHIARIQEADQRQISDGWAGVGTGILEDDAGLAKQGILQLLFFHEESFVTDGDDQSEKELMAIPATVGYLLVHRAGLDVPVGSPYIPDIYLDSPW